MLRRVMSTLHILLTLLLLPSQTKALWSEQEIVDSMRGKSRAYFVFLFLKGGFRSGMEVGVADGRYSELFLDMNAPLDNWSWHMVEPFPNKPLLKRYPQAGESTFEREHRLNWKARGIGKNANIYFYKKFSTDAMFLESVKDLQLDFLYLDGAHNYKNVKEELKMMWRNVRPGGVLAGHDYCNYGEPSLHCIGCENVPLCEKYTPYGVAHGKSATGRSANQNDVVRAVHEWLVESEPSLRLYHTTENFTQSSLAQDGLNYNLVITNSYNPSWFVLKPLV